MSRSNKKERVSAINWKREREKGVLIKGLKERDVTASIEEEREKGAWLNERDKRFLNWELEH